MYRSLFAVCVCCLLFAVCVATPAVASSFSKEIPVQFGNVSDPPSFAIPVAFKKMKAEEALARASTYEADLDAALEIPDYPAALEAFDSAAKLLAAVSQGAGEDRLASLRAKMEKALDAISFSVVSAPADTVSGTAFRKDFVARVSILTSSGKKPLAGFGCTVSCPSVSESGERVTLAENRTSLSDGTVSFTAPVPTKTGKNPLVIAAALTSSDPVIRDSIRARQERGQLAANFSHSVATAARAYSTVISILDYDLNGKPVLSANVSSTALLQPLVPKGFRRIGMADFPNQLATGDEAILIKAAKAQFGSGVQRFIFGTVRVASMVQGDDGSWTCVLASDVSVWDFASDSKVYHTTPSMIGSGATEALALADARKKLVGDALVNDLYYNM